MHLFCQIIINSLGLGVVLGGSLMITESSLRLAYNDPGIYEVTFFVNVTGVMRGVIL